MMNLLTLSILGGLAAGASAACSRAMLQDAVSGYGKQKPKLIDPNPAQDRIVRAQAAGLQNAPMIALASNISYAENDTPMDIKAGVLNQAITIDFNRSIYDTTQCATFTELSAATNKHPYVIATRMLFADNKVTAIQSIVTDDGDWAFNAAGELKWTKTEVWDTIPVDKRDTRAVIQAAGDAYLDSWGNGSIPVPYGAPCARLEGGSYTGTATTTTNTCKMPEFPQPFKITNRRYIIDEELGAVDIFNNFPFIDATKPDGTPSTNFIRVEGGRIRYIHEDTVCSAKNCGR